MQLAGRPLTPALEGRRYDPRWQWLCVYAAFEDSDGHQWVLYYWPAVSETSESSIVSVYRDGALLDLSELHLPPGSIAVGDHGADVRRGRSWLRGSYPGYRLFVDGTSADEPFELDLELRAESEAFEALAGVRGVTWIYVPRLAVSGTVRTASSVATSFGVGYLERHRGRFWAPGVREGLWETFPPRPRAGGMPLLFTLWRNDGSTGMAVVAVASDAGALVELDHVEVEVFETAATADGVEYPLVYRVDAEGRDGQLDALVTRSTGRLELRDLLAERRDGARSLGVYGLGVVDATARVGGAAIRFQGPTFGSSLRFWDERA